MENLSVKLWSIRTISSRRKVGALLPPKKAGLPLLLTPLAPGKMPPYLPPAFSNSWASLLSSAEGIVLLGYATKTGSATDALEGIEQDPVPPALGVLNVVIPALLKAVCSAGDSWFAHGTCNPELGTTLPLASLEFAGT